MPADDTRNRNIEKITTFTKAVVLQFIADIAFYIHEAFAFGFVFLDFSYVSCTSSRNILNSFQLTSGKV